MLSSRSLALLAGVASLMTLPATLAAERVQVVTSFSILADMVEHIGGQQVEVKALVGPDSDAHAYSPRPADARALAEADLVVFNGLQFEGWMERLVESSDYAGELVVATDGIEAFIDEAASETAPAHDEAHAHEEHGHEEHGHDAHGHVDHGDHAHGGLDPHTWQDLGLGELYVTNILVGLIAADPAHEADYRERAAEYLEQIASLHAEVQMLMDEIPDGTRVVTGHDSFGHFARAYDLHFLSPMGVSTASEAGAADMARLIDVIREQDIQALFHENMASPAMIDQLAEETGLAVAGTLYADALASRGTASTWLGMMRHNARTLHDALAETHEDSKDLKKKAPSLGP
ncbi:metal ABC transporter solute-binding protein, Zn/Mn family [Halomonas cerina]|uniref:Zinc/manganese transport system substrate-binding protein n=1 Tax=Halomonas cerina TaxID=447424 RepID=A0A839V8V1_9GAMM|nr:zinc ABC transporter substrate-binding protein [Halomonas cerina]MBB3190410.1 zinc/manganese transport system substrate-binding protein [Halomonas cerina]